MIEVRGLTKRYGDKVAVDNLTFGIEPGKVTGFLGPNGAGKTTTMRCILGLDYPTEGTITVGGKPFFSPHRAGISRYSSTHSLGVSTRPVEWELKNPNGISVRSAT